MASKYNLSKGVEKGFNFAVNDPDTDAELEFFLRYPCAADFEPSKEFDAKIEELTEEMNKEGIEADAKKRIQAEIDELEKKKASMFYNLVTPVGHDKSIEYVLQHVNVVVVRNFNKMVSGEFGN